MTGMGFGVVSVRFGITAQPPAIVMFYRKANSSPLRRRYMPVRGALSDETYRDISQQLITRHKDYLANANPDQILRLVRKIGELVGKGKNGEDFNKLDDDALDAKKREMDVGFDANRIKKDDPNFVYDKEVAFSDGRNDADSWDASSADTEDEVSEVLSDLEVSGDSF